MMEDSLNNISNWLKDSGLIVNANKTEICIFSKKDTATITITIDGQRVQSSKTINVLGITFDSKLTWGPQVTKAITESSRALNALRLIGRFFNREEKIQLVTSNYYSILFYNSEVWYLDNLKQNYKNMIFQPQQRH